MALHVELTWELNDSAENPATSLKVSRKLGAGTYSELATLDPTATSYRDETAVYGNQYTYRVQSFNQAGTQTTAPEVLITVEVQKPNPVVNLTAVVRG